jgi:hypothetical protein
MLAKDLLFTKTILLNWGPGNNESQANPSNGRKKAKDPFDLRQIKNYP